MAEAGRSTWSGAITISGLPIPIKLYNSSKSATVAFKNVHSTCGTPINAKKFCAKCNMDVEAADLNKGFKLGKDNIIVFTEAEIGSIEKNESHNIKIEASVESSEITHNMIDSVYFAAPDKYGEQAYSILAKTLEKSQSVLIGKISMRGKEHLASIMYFEGGITLSTLKWADELYTGETLLEGLVAVNEPEVAMFSTLIEGIKGKFEHGRYHDNYREQIEALIQMKASGQIITVKAAEPVKPAQSDFMAMLKQAVAGQAAGVQEAIAPKAKNGKKAAKVAA